MSREVPNLELELGLAARSRFRRVRRHHLIETAYLRGRGSVVWRQTIHVSPGMQVEMIVVMDACIGRLWQIVDTVVMAARMVTRSTSRHLKSRIRTRCAKFLPPRHFHSFITYIR
jgi:hypothetical protein